MALTTKYFSSTITNYWTGAGTPSSSSTNSVIYTVPAGRTAKVIMLGFSQVIDYTGNSYLGLSSNYMSNLSQYIFNATQTTYIGSYVNIPQLSALDIGYWSAGSNAYPSSNSRYWSNRCNWQGAAMAVGNISVFGGTGNYAMAPYLFYDGFEYMLLNSNGSYYSNSNGGNYAIPKTFYLGPDQTINVSFYGLNGSYSSVGGVMISGYGMVNSFHSISRILKTTMQFLVLEELGS